MKKYSLLYFQHLCDKYSKWIFPLHEGENIIGSDKTVDIFLYLNENEDKIESVHCKIIVNENNISIISLTENGNVKKYNKDENIVLLPGKVYELKNKSIFYLGNNLKFMIINDTDDDIYNFFIEQRLDNEYQKWKQLITYQESNIKIDLNLARKESLNKSIISNISNNNNNNLNLNNNNISNSLLRSNTKEVNRIGFNNFDEVPEDNWLNDNENLEDKNNKMDISQVKPINDQNQNSNINTIKYSIDETPKKSQDINICKNNININDIRDMLHSNEMKIKNEFSENIINFSNNISKETYDENNINTKVIKPLKDKYYEEKIINKDEKTAQMIKELLGENNLELIIKNTDFKKIKKFDIYCKKANKNKIDSGNFDIKFINKTNIFGNK